MTDYDLVFCTRVVSPLMRRNRLRQFKVAPHPRWTARLDTLHDLRHAHATLTLRAGVPIKTAGVWLGPAGITIAGDLYQHTSPPTWTNYGAERAAAVLAG
jgi:integrase